MNIKNVTRSFLSSSLRLIGKNPKKKKYDSFSVVLVSRAKALDEPFHIKNNFFLTVIGSITNTTGIESKL